MARRTSGLLLFVVASALTALILVGFGRGASAATLNWDANTGTSGVQDGGGTWNTLSTNWWNGASNSLFLPTDDAVFGNGTSGAAGSVNIGLPAVANSLTFNAPFSGNYMIGGSALTVTTGDITANSDATIGSALSVGVGSLDKEGPASVFLTASNLYLFPTHVNAGMLSIGNGGTSGSLNTLSAITVAAGATLQWNNANQTPIKTISNVINGNGTVRVQGQNSSAALSRSQYDFTGNNTGLTGEWLINGALVWNTSAQSDLGLANIRVQNNGTIGFNGNTFSNNIIIEDGAGWHHNVSGDVVIGAIRMEGTNILNGNVTLNQTTGTALADNTGDHTTVGGYNTGNHTFNGVISGPGEFSMSRLTSYNGGSPQFVDFTLTGNQSNTYTGKTVVNGQGARASLILNKSGGTVAIPAGNTVQMGNDTGGQFNLKTLVDNQFGVGAVIDWQNNAGQWGRFDLKGTNQTVAGLTGGIANPSMILQNQGFDAVVPAGDATLTLDGSGNYAAYGYVRDQDNGGTARKLNIVKNGSGTQILGNQSGNTINFTGTTIINSGIMAHDTTLSGAGNWTSPITVNSGGTFKTTGTNPNSTSAASASLTLNGGQYIHETTAANAYKTFAGLLTVATPSTVQVNNTNTTNNNVYFDGGLTGSNPLTLTSTGGGNNGPVFRTANSTNTFTGPLLIDSGNVFINASGSLMFAKSDVTVNTGATLRLNANWASGAGNATIKSLNGSGDVVLGGRLTTGENDGNGTFSGVVSGANGVTKTGGGTQFMNGTSTYTSSTIVSGGILAGTGSAGSSAHTVNSGGTLMGGLGAGNTGTYSTGNLTFQNSGAKLRVNTNGSNAVSRINAGVVALNNMTVDVMNTVSAGTYTLIAGSSVSGTATLGINSAGCANLIVTPTELQLVVVCVSEAPGGVTNGLAYWIKANGQITDPGSSITSWIDETGVVGDFHSTIGDPDLTPGYNFNPTVNFDGNDYVRVKMSSRLIPSATDGEIFYQLENLGAHNTADGYPGEFGGSGVLTSQYDYNNSNVYDTFGSTVRKNWNPLSAPAGGGAVNVQDPHIYNVYSAPGDWAANFDGRTNFQTNSNTVSFATTPSSNTYVGASHLTQFKGNISEVTLFSRKLTLVERQRVNSYLAVKYGLTLNQSTATDYLDSTGTSFWSAATNSGFDKNITAIGRDDISLLEQKQSKSVNPNGLVTIGKGVIVGDNASNSGSFAADKDFLSFGDSGANIAYTSIGAPAGRQILERKWKAQETGTNANDYVIQVPDNSSSLTTELPAELNTVYLLVDTDSNFTSGAIEIAMTLNGDKWEASGVDLDNGQFFTFATQKTGATINQASGQADPTNTNPINFTVVFSGAINPGTFTASDVVLTGTGAGSVGTPATADNITWTVPVTATADGTITASLPADTVVSNAGFANDAATSSDNSVFYDITPPEGFAVNADITSPGHDMDNPLLSFSTVDYQTGISHYEVSLDGGPFSTEVSPFSPSLTPAASHTATVRAYDLAGNYTERSVAWPPSVIINAPTTASNAPITDTTISVEGPVGMIIDSVSISGAGSSGFNCGSLPAAVPITCSGGTINSTGVLTVTATPNSGSPATNSQSYIIDTTVPDVTLNQKVGTPDPTSVNSAKFTIVFSKTIDGSTFSTSDFVVGGSTALVTSLTQIDPVTWEAEVTGMFDGDTVSLDLPANSVKDPFGNDNTASTSSDNSVTYDTSPPTATINQAVGQGDPTGEAVIEFTVEFSEQVGGFGPGDVVISGTAAASVQATATSDNQTWTVFVNTTSDGTVVANVPANAAADSASNPTLAATFTDNEVMVENLDTDGDDLTDVEESVAPGGDGNGDGIADHLQQEVGTLTNPVTGNHMTIVTDGNCIMENGFNVLAETDLPVQDNDFSYPVGLNDFVLTCAEAGDSSIVTFYYSQAYDTSSWSQRKFSAESSAYFDMTAQTTTANQLVLGNEVTVVSYELTDGGPLDMDGAADGLITDPAGPAVLAETTSNGGTSSDGGSSSGDLAGTGVDTRDLAKIPGLLLGVAASVGVLLIGVKRFRKD